MKQDRPPCHGKTDLFFPDTAGEPDYAPALAICKVCPLETRRACFDAGYTEDWGVWGGATPTDRIRASVHRLTKEDLWRRTNRR